MEWKSGLIIKENMLKEVKEYFNNGMLSFHYFVDEQDNYHGSYKDYKFSGELFMCLIYKNGRGHGVTKVFFTNEILISVFKNSVNNGVKINFNF